MSRLTRWKGISIGCSQSVQLVNQRCQFVWAAERVRQGKEDCLRDREDPRNQKSEMYLEEDPGWTVTGERPSRAW